MALPKVSPSPLEVSGLRVGVIGAARSGVGSARLLSRAGAEVVVGDAKPAEELDPKIVPQIGAAGAEVRPGATTLDDFGPVDLLIVSPGVPVDAPILQQARAARVPFLGEVELAYRFCPAPIVAIAGTNGKGTTVTLTGAMLNQGGLRARVCGNIGDPFSGAVAEGGDPDLFVVEISSFQLETVDQFRPWIALLLNVTPDHLDRHRTLETYLAAKARLFENQTPEDWAVLNARDANVAEAARGTHARRLHFSAGPDGEAHVEGESLVVNLGSGPVEICRQQDLVRAGVHYTESALAAASAALIAGASLEGIRAALRTHQLPEHVLEVVGEVGGVQFINSSKATNPSAAEADMESVSGPLLVIAGGLEKKADFTEFGELLRRRAKAVFLIGECAGRIAEAAAGVPSTRCESLEEAVEKAFALASPGDRVILAPACASWDMFPSYKVRGDRFRTAAQRLCRAGAKGVQR